MNRFRQAVEADDIEAAVAELADDVVFRSPVAFSPYPGKPITAAILRAVFQVFDDFHYVREIADPSGDHALVFEAKVNGLDITGCDFLTYNEAGKIVDFMVMVRPMRAAQALAEEMGARFEQIKADAIASTS